VSGHHITDYAILSNEDSRVLEKKVSAAIHDGWQPFGSLGVIPRGDGFAAIFAQPMVKYTDHFG